MPLRVLILFSYILEGTDMASSKHHPIVCPTLAVIVILGYWTTAWAVEFAGGTGEPNDPYRIATAEQLIAISSDSALFDRHFVLMADIDLDPNLPGRKVFSQALLQWGVTRTWGAQGTYFHGSFNGGGHVVRNWVLYSGSEYAGFFGRIAPEAVVRDLHLDNVVVADFNTYNTAGSSSGSPGILAAVNEGIVTGCSATGTLAAYATSGGLIGLNTGLVTGCHARCEILGRSVGGLIGTNEATGRVALCGSDGTLYGGSQAGGLVATNRGTIQYCKASGLVSAAGAGGLIGDNSGTIRESYATAFVFAGQQGGGVASNNGGTIVNCYVTGFISSAHPDGLAGINRGTLLSSYSTTVSQSNPTPKTGLRSLALSSQSSSDDSEPGELAVLSDVKIAAAAQGTVRYAYYLDPDKPPGQTGSTYSGYGVPLWPAEMEQASSFVGFDFYGDANDGPAGHWFMPPDGYPVLTWQTQITGLVGVADVSGLSPEQAGLVLEAMGLEPNGVTYDYAKLEMVSDAGTTREVQKGQVILAKPAGYLRSGSPVGTVVSLGRCDFSKNPGDGSESNPYQIATAGQLDSLYDGTIPAGLHVILTADIDLSGYVYPGPLIRQVWGEFDGNGHTIRGLQIAVPASAGPECALFARVESTGFVHDLIVDQASLSAVAQGSVGILVGENKGQVLRCEATGRIVGGYLGIGGLVGHNDMNGQLTDCRFSGRIRPADESRDIGGLVGNNMGAIVRCCARDVDVSGGQDVGGLVGENGYETGLIEACYATGAVQGVVHVGGLVGQNGHAPPRGMRPVLAQSQIATSADPVANGIVRDCYAACSVTGEQYVGGCIGLAAVVEAVQESCFFLDPKDGGGPDNGLGTLLTASQMGQQASFAGWDFIDTWTICEGKDSPRLRWERVVCE
jgi:hypothetical protein